MQQLFCAHAIVEEQLLRVTWNFLPRGLINMMTQTALLWLEPHIKEIKRSNRFIITWQDRKWKLMISVSLCLTVLLIWWERLNTSCCLLLVPVHDIRLLLDSYMYLDCLLTSSVYDISTLSRPNQTICFQSSLEFHCKHKHMTPISNVCKFQVFFILVFMHWIKSCNWSWKIHADQNGAYDCHGGRRPSGWRGCVQ